MPPRSTLRSPTFVSSARSLGTDYVIHVETPEPEEGTGPWPLALFMDGDYAIDAALWAYRSLRESGEIQPCVIAAIGYGQPFGSPLNHRGRDYTPTASPEEPDSGGADRFVDYLTGQLWKELASRYPLRDDVRLVGGHSLGALVALHALFRPKPFFNRILAGAPSLWWDNRSPLRLASAHRDRHPSLDARLFLGIGTLDTESMTSDLALFEEQLKSRPYERLEVTIRRFPGKDHYNVGPELFREGLKGLIGPQA